MWEYLICAFCAIAFFGGLAALIIYFSMPEDDD